MVWEITIDLVQLLVVVLLFRDRLPRGIQRGRRLSLREIHDDIQQVRADLDALATRIRRE